MCGIVGYVGDKQALPILMDKLQMLTYRGYDSAGVAVVDNGVFYVEKCKGKVSELAAIVDPGRGAGSVGLGHTRWATHGEPSTRNAHPHLDCTGEISIVQNGIVENYWELKQELIKEGHVFHSDTDTEVIAHLIEELYDDNITTAVHLAMQRMRGSMAIVVIHKNEPDRIVAAKMDSPPLIVGLGRGENHIASDIPALLHHTNKIYVMEDGEIATVTRDNVIISNFRQSDSPRLFERKVTVIEWSAETAQKAGFPHYMLKEIHEQPTTVEDTIRGRLGEHNGAGPAAPIEIPELNLSAEEARQIERLTFVACGTAYHACLVGKYLFEQALRIPVNVDVGSEYRYRHPIIGRNEVMVAVSQSGETADTIASMREGLDQGAKVLAITNVLGSSVARLADGVLYTRAGPEVAVASTKAFIGQLTAFHVLLQYIAQFRELSPETRATLAELRAGLWRLPDQIRAILADTERVRALALEISERDACFFIGRNLDEPIAREGALKLKEISYIHSQGYAAGELKHGTLALLDEGVPVLSLATQGAVYDKMVSNIQEVLARRAWAIGIVPEGDRRLTQLLGPGNILSIPRTHDWLHPILTTVQVQLLSYFASDALGRDIDQPRNLAKSVTVE
ncbi:MAG TPA: glutamine--fructose-6-phosphate transaminase (isomerizing) [Ardenticatenaceae bacterium]|nr:glutamine--fructose-6-phosphate transaminase (isomerizing) [Ardenticatenaceae bacterium]